MTINPVQFAHSVRDEFLRYIFSGFPLSDPRHGSTWDDCRNDAIIRLDSEEVVEECLTQSTSTGEDDEEEPFQLISEPTTKRDSQSRLFL